MFKLSKYIYAYRSATKIYILMKDDLYIDKKQIKNKCDWFNGFFSRLREIGKNINCKSKFIASLPEDKVYIVRQWKYSDKFNSSINEHSYKVSDLFIDNKLNYVQKRIQPIVTDMNDNIMWIPGLAHARFYPSESYINYLWEP